MVNQLRQFAGEVTRVAKAVGTDGILGSQAVVENVEVSLYEFVKHVGALGKCEIGWKVGIGCEEAREGRGDEGECVAVEDLNGWKEVSRSVEYKNRWTHYLPPAPSAQKRSSTPSSRGCFEVPRTPPVPCRSRSHRPATIQADRSLWRASQASCALAGIAAASAQVLYGMLLGKWKLHGVFGGAP